MDGNAATVHGHVASVTRSTTAKNEEEAARWRSIIAVMATNKYLIITLNNYLKLQKRGQQGNRRRWHSFNLYKDLYHGIDQHCLSQTTTDV